MILYFKQFGRAVNFIHSDHENALMSAISFLNWSGIQHSIISTYQHEQNFERYVQIINFSFRSVLSSLKFNNKRTVWTIIYSNTKISAQFYTYTIYYLQGQANAVGFGTYSAIKLISSCNARSPLAPMPQFTAPSESTSMNPYIEFKNQIIKTCTHTVLWQGLVVYRYDNQSIYQKKLSPRRDLPNLSFLTSRQTTFRPEHLQLRPPSPITYLKLNRTKEKEVYSVIMAIMYVARLTRPDVILATAYLDRVTIKRRCASFPTQRAQ